MRSKKIEFRIPWHVFELAEERAQYLGYRNVGRYFLGMTMADILLSGWGARMRNIANSDPNIQDYLVDQILRLPVEQIELAAFLRRLALLPKGGNGGGMARKKKKNSVKRKMRKKKGPRPPITVTVERGEAPLRRLQKG